MSDTTMNCALSMKGSLCGCETTFCGGYGKEGMQYSANIIVTKHSLEELVGTLGSQTKNIVSPYIELLDDFTVESKFSHNQNGTVIIIQSDAVRFIGLDTKQGKMVAFDISFYDLLKTKDGILATLVNSAVNFFGIKSFKFLYRSTDLTSSNIYKKYNILPAIPDNVKGNVILNSQFKFDEIASSIFTKAMTELFGIKEMDLFIFAGTSDFACVLTIPDIENSLLKCRNVKLLAEFGKATAKFAMSGSIALKCFSGMEFALNCEISLTSVSISASSMPTNVYRIPHTPISICNSGLEIGVSERGINISIMSQINIANLMWFGALRISYQGSTAMLDMISAAMNEVSLSSLVENVTGMQGENIKALDVVAVEAFDINSSRRIEFNKLTDHEIIEQINNNLHGMKPEFLLDDSSTSITRMPSGKACDVLNTKTMFHYWINSNGELAFPPQMYYSSKHITIGKYNFEQGMFFCGKLKIFGEYIKVMFSAVYGQGVIGYAQINPIKTRVINISGSKSSRNMPNLVLGTSTNSTLSLLTSDFSSDRKIDNPAVLYVNVSRNSCNFYIDAHFDLCNIFSFDTLMYYMNKKVFMSVSTSYFNMISASVMMEADYNSMMNAAFTFQVALDCTGLHDKLTELTRLLDDAVEKYNNKIGDAQRQIKDAKNKVNSLQNEINSYIRKINDCKSTIKNTKKIKRWLVAIREGIKISAYEVAIVSIKVAMKTAQAALDIANKTLQISGKIGTKVINAINSVVKGVLDVFYINKALLGIIVNGNTKLVHTNLDVTVLGKDFNVKYEVDLETLAKAPIKYLEQKIIDNIKDFINQLRNGEYESMNMIECLEYAYMDDEPDVLNAADMISYGTHRVNQAGNMIMDLQKLYVNEMHQIDPDFDNLETEYNDTLGFLAYAMEKSSQNMYSEGMDELIGELQIALDENSLNESEAVIAKECIEQYVNEIRPANTMVEENSNRIAEYTENIQHDNMKSYFCQYRNDNEDYTGTDVIENRDYARMFNEVEAIVTKYYPEGSGNGFFNFTDEENFYVMLNEARQEAGCAYVSDAPDTTEENDLISFYNEKHEKFTNSTYRQRLL